VCVTGWAQSPGNGFEKRYQANKNSLRWVPHWYKIRLNDLHSALPFYGNISVRYVLLFVLLSSLAFIVSIKSFFQTSNKAQFFLFITLLLNSLYWFMTGPDYRFGFPTFIILLTTLAWKTNENRIYPLPMLFLVICTPYQLWDFGVFMSSHYTKPILWKENLVSFKNIGKPIIHLDSSYIYNQNKSDSLKYYFPVGHDHTPIDKFPCLPHEVHNVTLYGKSNQAFKFLAEPK
jgi:hypothetical protein